MAEFDAPSPAPEPEPTAPRPKAKAKLMWQKVQRAKDANALGELFLSQDNETIFVEDEKDAAEQQELVRKKQHQRAKWRSAMAQIRAMRTSVAIMQSAVEEVEHTKKAVTAVMVNMALKVMADTSTIA